MRITAIRRVCTFVSFVGLASASLFGGCAEGRHDDPTPNPPPTDPIDPPSTPTPASNSVVYAHSGNQLFKIDADALDATLVGNIVGQGSKSITDIAVDKNGRILGITMTALYEISPNGAATLVSDLTASAQGFTSLSFVPTDINDITSDEYLVAANDDGDVFRIDEETGTATKLGNYGTIDGDDIRSSGDIVAIYNVGIFATVNVGSNWRNNDYLVELDPTTWKATLPPNDTGFDRIFGLGYWGGKFFGFVDGGADGTPQGQLVEINQATGAAELLFDSDVRWYGAGVTTVAPDIS